MRQGGGAAMSARVHPIACRPVSSDLLNVTDALDEEINFASGMIAAFEWAIDEGGIGDNKSAQGAIVVAHAHIDRLRAIAEKLEMMREKVTAA